MNTRTKIAIIAITVGVLSIAWSVPSWAHGIHPHYEDHRDYRRDYRHYHHNHQRRRSDNDDVAWAVGGLILGTIIANSANENRTESNTQSRLPPPQRRVQTCYDEVAYDENDKPYVLRRCFETLE